MRTLTTIAIVSLLGLAACGSCSEEKPGKNNTGDASPIHGDGALDGTVSSADGTSGSDGTGTGGDTSGSRDGCPRYQAKCGGKCVPTSVDPDNCGSCGNKCTGTKVCSSGTCTDECLPGRSKCDNRCVDLDTDSDNCGSCGRECPDGKGCVNQNCVDQIDVGDAPKKCENGGPSISVQGRRKNKKKKCIGNVAGNTFTWGVCSCDSLDAGNEFLADAFDSTLGPYQRGGFGGSVGTNGYFEAGNNVWIFGNLWASGSEGVKVGNTLELAQQLHSGGLAEASGKMSYVGRDGFVEGNVKAGEKFEFKQKLFVRPNSQLDQGVTYQKLVRKQVNVADPCTRCKQSNRIPIDDIVKRRRNGNNDNSKIGLKADALASQNNSIRLDLPCGEYYLSRVDIGNSVSIVAHGNTAIYIDGNVEAGNFFDIKPDPSAQLDVFVTGNVELGNESSIGSPAYPASMRMYIGGNEGWKIGNKIQIGANIYAIPGGIEAGNELEVFGGLYVQKLKAGNKAKIHYDREVLDSGKDCPDDDGGDGMDAGMGSDPDGGGGTTDQCKQKDQGCSSDSDCCSPLVCDQGTCSAITCVPLHDDCSKNSDCCSGTCATSGGKSVCVGT